MYKKAWCTCNAVVLRNEPIAFLTSSLPSPSSLLNSLSLVKLSGESPSLSARRLCKTCIFNESFCKERGGLESLKNSFWNVLPNMFLFCLGIAKIAFQLDAVKFAIELILRIQNNDQSSVCTCSFGWVAWKSKRSGVSPSLSARELGFYWLWLASPFWTK